MRSLPKEIWFVDILCSNPKNFRYEAALGIGRRDRIFPVAQINFAAG
jgi:hypothetical protein